MKYEKWSISSDDISAEKRQSHNALFSIGNGYFGIRGFFEEDTETEVGNGGIYVAGIVGAGVKKSNIFEGESRDLCNILNVLRLHILADGQPVDGVHDIADFSRFLDMRNATYSRSYTWNHCLEIELLRFADMADVHRIGQRVQITALKSLNLVFRSLLDSKVKNLNYDSIEPLPIQPGAEHIVSRKIGVNSLAAKLDDSDATTMYAAQDVCVSLNGKRLEGKHYADDYACGMCYELALREGDVLCLEKIACVYTDKDEPNPEKKIETFLSEKHNYSEILNRHIARWAERWQASDVEIDSDTDDQTALRYDLFELMCACPTHSDKVSIGARGLTGEMYEGCVFWDNEIFQLPFFTFTDPASTRRMLAWRYHTLDQARRYAEYNWFKGAMYPWQSCEKGIEQTPFGDGGFYAIHIVADIAYAIRQYIAVTGDEEFLWEMGAEILLETARFWESRADYSETDGHWHINAVRGPNEYDIYVNDNAYTNNMAITNFRTAAEVLKRMSVQEPKRYQVLAEKTGFHLPEIEKWLAIADNLYLCYDSENHLVAEDANYFNRRPLDLKRAKPTAKRIIDSTMNYEMLALYQITKQSDVITLMCLVPELFTEQEKTSAYDYYEPRTAHDSSLSYAPYAWLASQLGKSAQAYEYFKNCAYLDIADIKLNTVSGLHFANFGGTWQVAVFGFGGASFADGKLTINPHLPSEWNAMTYHICCQGVSVTVKVEKDHVTLTADKADRELPVCVCGNNAVLHKNQLQMKFPL